MNTKAFLLFLFISTTFFGQDYSAQWEGHYSYLNITGISNDQDEILASAENAIFKYNPISQENSNTSTINGLTGESISYFHHSEAYNTSVIGYENGLIEIITDNDVITVVDILNKPTIAPNEKRINHIYEYNGLVYLSCDFGISTYSLERLEFADSYFIGTGGTQLSVKQITIKDDYIYAATTTEGIKRALHADPNIIDFALWQTISAITNWKSIVTFNNSIYAVDNTNMIYEYDLISFNNLFNYPSDILDHRINDDKMILTSANKAYFYSAPFTNILTIDNLAAYGSNFTVSTIFNESIYIGTENDGLLSFNLTDGINTSQIKPNGLLENNVFSVTANDSEVWTVYGNHSLYYDPSPVKSQGFSHLKNNLWLNTPYSNVLDAKNLVDVSVNPFNKNQVFISSYHSGGLLEVNDDIPTILYDQTNSALESLGPYLSPPAPTYISIRVGKSTFDRDGKLWLTNNKVASPLKVYDPQNNTWESHSFLSIITSPVYDEDGFGKIVIDQNNNKWIASIKNGLIGFSQNSGTTILKNLTAETGNLPRNEIRGLAIDKDNNLWIGTIQGLRVLYNTAGFFTAANPQAESIIILDDGIPKELMFGQFITAIEVDGANNKWIATFDAGVFYLSSNGQETIHHFTKDNSPLPSNSITDISIDDVSGKVYFATPKGMVAFNSNATNSSSDLENVTVQPNPVRPNYNGNIIIKGLVDGANIKITDISGNLVDENTVTGGTYEWNQTAFGAHKVASGVYVIMITTKDGTETTVEKVMIVR